MNKSTTMHMPVNTSLIYGNQVLDYLLLSIEVALLFILNICEMVEPSDVEGSIFS